MTEVKLDHPGGQLSMPVHPAVEGPAGIGVSKLLKETGMTTYDPGFVNTAAASSAITYIDGDAGILRYRGYPIEQLAEKSSFLEVSYLLIYGELPTEQQLTEFTEWIRRHSLLHEEMRRFFDGFPGTPTRWPCSPRRSAPSPPSTRTAWTRSTPSTWRSPRSG
ncbi:hypothetical protein GCM10027614_15830 [Micromonospora vulcania]